MIKTKSVYDPVEKTDGKRFLVTCYWPRGLSKDKLKLAGWLRDLAPSKILFKNWKDAKITWQKYELRYYKEMESQKQLIKELAKLSETSTITLLCFEKEDNSCCHRHLLKNLVRKDLK